MIIPKSKLQGLTKKESLIVEFIAKASSVNPVTISNLSKFTNIPERAIKETIKRLREKFPIISLYKNSSNGYYITNKQEDILTFINDRKVYIKTLQKTIKNMQNFLK